MNRADRRACLWASVLMFIVPLAALFVSCTPARADTLTDQAYIETLDHFVVPYSTPAKAIYLGHAVCAAFEGGLDFDDAVQVMGDAGWRPLDAGYVVGAAIGSYCPEYEYLLRSGAVAA